MSASAFPVVPNSQRRKFLNSSRTLSIECIGVDNPYHHCQLLLVWSWAIGFLIRTKWKNSPPPDVMKNLVLETEKLPCTLKQFNLIKACRSALQRAAWQRCLKLCSVFYTSSVCPELRAPSGLLKLGSSSSSVEKWAGWCWQLFRDRFGKAKLRSTDPLACWTGLRGWASPFRQAQWPASFWLVTSIATSNPASACVGCVVSHWFFPCRGNVFQGIGDESKKKKKVNLANKGGFDRTVEPMWCTRPQPGLFFLLEVEACQRNAAGWSTAVWPANAKLPLPHLHSPITRCCCSIERSSAKLLVFTLTCT